MRPPSPQRCLVKQPVCPCIVGVIASSTVLGAAHKVRKEVAGLLQIISIVSHCSSIVRGASGGVEHGNEEDWMYCSSDAGLDNVLAITHFACGHRRSVHALLPPDQNLQSVFRIVLLARQEFAHKGELQAAINTCCTTGCSASDAPCEDSSGALINEWDVSRVKDFSMLFYDFRTFNQPINDWDTSKVTTLYQSMCETPPHLPLHLPTHCCEPPEQCVI